MAYKNLEITPTNYNSQHTDKLTHYYKGFSTTNPDNRGSKLYDFELIKQNILNYVLKSYYHVYLIYTKNNSYTNVHYKEMFNTVIKNEKHILFDNFDK